MRGAQLIVGATNAGLPFWADRFLPLAFSSKIPREHWAGRYAAGCYNWRVALSTVARYNKPACNLRNDPVGAYGPANAYLAPTLVTSTAVGSF
jgi:hypothetical protein